jgi:hypothetical protein
VEKHCVQRTVFFGDPGHLAIALQRRARHATTMGLARRIDLQTTRAVEVFRQLRRRKTVWWIAPLGSKAVAPADGKRLAVFGICCTQADRNFAVIL